MKKFIGIDIGGSFIKYGTLDENGNLLHKDNTPTTRNDPEQVLEKLTAIILEESKGQVIAGVSISTPGVVDLNNKLLTSGAIKGLFKYDVQAILSEKTGLKIKLVNDAKSIGYAEGWLGAGANCENFVCLPLELV